MSKIFIAALLAAAVASGCASTASRKPVAIVAEPVTPAQPAAPAANDNLNAVAWTQTAVERDLIYRQAYKSAQEHLLRALKDPRWEALAQGERSSPMRKLGKAVIVDVDETVLDNSPYQARLVTQGNAFDEFTWAEWCREERAQALPGALEFARFAASKGVTVFYLSNRASDLHDATVSNLRKVGFPVAANETVFLGLGTIVDGCEQNGSEKGCRRGLIARKYRVLMQIGDQLGDFVDVVANTADGRRAAIAPYLGWIGERWFVLPNPTYGAWEPALFNNSWQLPADERRKAKWDALRTD